MDQLFLVDTMQTQHVLGVTCGHLTLEDLFNFENVTAVSQDAVKVHHYDNLVELGTFAIDLTKRLVGDDGSRLAGPILSRLSIQLDLRRGWFAALKRQEEKMKGWAWDWELMLSTLVQRAAHVKHLELDLQLMGVYKSWLPKSVPLSREKLDEMDERADSLLAGVMFDQCTHLRLMLVMSPSEATYKEVSRSVLSTLLDHFPALEHLRMTGERLPFVSCLPAPVKLKSLQLTTFMDEKHQTGTEPIIGDFSGLESITLLNSGKQSCCEMMEGLDSQTGLDWVESFEHHPPGDLQNITLSSLTKCVLPLLGSISSSSAPSCLTLICLPSIDQSTAEVFREAGICCFLRNVTHLVIYNLSDDDCQQIDALLAFTPAVHILELHFADYCPEKPFKLKQPLYSLVKLVIETGQTNHKSLSWMRSVIEKPAGGLQIVHNGSELRKWTAPHQGSDQAESDRGDDE